MLEDKEGNEMELRVLRYFLEVVKEENITHAANLLHLSQPTLSRQLVQMEEELGVQLFIRGKRKIILTEEGLLLAHRAKEIIEMVDKTENELSEQKQLVNGKIMIGAGELAASKIFPQLIETFSSKYPMVTYDLYTGNADEIKNRIDNGLLDFGLLLEPVSIEKYDFVRLKIKERWGILMKANDALAEKEAVTPLDLKNSSLILTNRSEIMNEFANWYGKDFGQLKIIASHNMISNVALLVEHGLGYATTVEGAVTIFDSSRTCFRPLSPSISTNSVIAWKKHQIFSPTKLKFLNHLKQTLED